VGVAELDTELDDDTVAEAEYVEVTDEVGTAEQKLLYQVQ